jgi:hypothetical protein
LLLDGWKHRTHHCGVADKKQTRLAWRNNTQETVNEIVIPRQQFGIEERIGRFISGRPHQDVEVFPSAVGELDGPSICLRNGRPDHDTIGIDQRRDIVIDNGWF